MHLHLLLYYAYDKEIIFVYLIKPHFRSDGTKRLSTVKVEINECGDANERVDPLADGVDLSIILNLVHIENGQRSTASGAVLLRNSLPPAYRHT